MIQKVFYTYYVIQERHTVTQKTFAHAERIPNQSNLLCVFQPMLDFEITSVNACRTYAEARRTADVWNDCAKAKGEYAFE